MHRAPAATDPGGKSCTSAEFEITVEALLRRIIALLEQQQQRQPPSHLTRADRDRLAKVLPVITGVFGSELFIVSELYEHESAGLRLVLADINRKQLGRLLQRAQGAIVAGFVVQRDGSEAGAVLWRVLAATL